MSLIPSPWRAWNTFLACLLGAFISLTASMTVAGALRLKGDELNTAQTDALLAGLYWGTYPLVFVGLVALAWHFVRSERGDYV